MKLQCYKVITGTLRCESGLHIGGSADQIEIGGVDSPIIKHQVNGEPYIPGSSLKGKMRSQLEKKEGKATDRGEPCGCGGKDCKICKIFGAHKNTRHNLGATRILVRDAYFSDKTRHEYQELIKEKGTSYIEKKTENTVNRKTGTAEHPRSLERVPSGAEFDIEIVIQVYDTDGNGNDMVEFVKEGLRNVQKTYLGGFGSRGSGKVSFKDMKLDGTGFVL
ncbi:type III-A CRISPR-associated RAMP protein Csm3 [Candidatus Magnetominusculus xianensis]|uniref:CRISPR system Cms endoribonuclease Csm3 n=1 Tax=Candidatus Magnetominusculus xianensis TaxID=1748249 RepID=A0ABR5SJP4_9BACT|nr:type III-A CRISPR-associated RAMP protein Csm3 [Candidatus Magnetominusculus xianensis]KWT94952.1 CRISPR-associated protein Csm3 [Candidatus Magnetominusculus xianensis]MBF0405198.1 type III-A CRISPR-associated RAMP protein Csm3 [Nitrospirota bacterium]